RIAQSSALPPIADEPASPIGDDNQGEACLIDSGLEPEQDRANITKTSTLPNDSTPRVTSLAADKDSMKHKLTELIDLFTHLQRQQDKMALKITAQDLEIATLKARIKHLEDRNRGDDEPSGEDAIIKGRRLETGKEAAIERSTEKGSDDTEEMVNVLTSLDAASILSSGVEVTVPPVAEVATISIPPTGEIHPISVPTGSGVVPTASLIFTTVATPYTRRKGKEKMVESDTPKKKKLQEQIDVQIARQLKEEMERDAQRMNEQITRDAEIARIHAEEELQIMIDGLDMNNETVAKYLHFKGMTLEEIKEKFDPVWKQIEYFIPIGSKEEGERFKRKGLRLEQDSAKKVNILEEISEEDLKAMMQLVPIEEVYVEALQLWALVKETLNIRHATSNKEKELWVELKSCGVHHILLRDQEIFMLVEREYPLRKGLEIVMISNKLQVENYSQMASDLIQKIHKIANSPR
nr:hypothetical protein [Tanacetum cinerariifolium]